MLAHTLVFPCVLCTGFAPTTTLAMPSKLGLSKVRIVMDDAAEEAPAEENKESVLDSLSAGNADLLDKIKGLTLLEASELIKEAEKAFNVGPKDDEDDAPSED